MIERLVIQRFRGIREGELDDIKRVNLLIGPNNSGKTAILEMLYLAGTSGRACALIMQDVKPSVWPAQTLLPFDMLGVEPMVRMRDRHGEPKKKQDAPADLTADDSLSVIMDSVTENHPLHQFQLAARLEKLERRVFSKKDIQRVTLFQLEPWFGKDDYEIPASLIPPSFEDKNVRIMEGCRWVYMWEKPFVYAWNKQKDLDHFAVWAVFGSLSAAEHTLFFDFHTANNPFTARFAQKAYEKIPDWEEEITKHFIQVFPFLKGAKISVRPLMQSNWTGSVEWPGKSPIYIDHFGDGARHAFKVLAALIAMGKRVDEKHPGLFLWEDPELFMHPASLLRLLQQVMLFIKEKPIQVFISTQSLEVVALLTHYFQSEANDWKKELRAFRLNLEEDKMYAATFRFENLKAWLEQEMDPRYWGVSELPFSYHYGGSEDIILEEEI